MTDYTTKIKEICHALGSINVIVDENKMVQIFLGDLAQWYRPIRTTICTGEKPPSFFNLQSMLMVEENHASGSRTTQVDNQMPYTEVDRPRNEGGRQEQNRRHRDSADRSFGPSTSKGSENGTRNRQETADTECWYCGKKGHRGSECWKLPL